DPLAIGVPLVQNVTLRDRGPGAYLGASFKRLSFMSSFTELQEPTFVRGWIGENRWRREFADLGYRIKTSENWKMGLNASFTRTTLRDLAYPFIKRDAHEFLLEWTNLVTLSDRDQLTFGALLNRVRGREMFYGVQPAAAISDGSRPGFGAYAQL